MSTNPEFSQAGQKARQRKDILFKWVSFLITWISAVFLLLLLVHIAISGIKYLDWDFLSNFPSRFPEKAGLKSALIGSLWMIALVFIIAVPLGVASAIYLEEYSRKSTLRNIVEINISNLAGVPSIVYGILGLAIFVRFFGLRRSILAGSLTMSLLILPVIIIAARESLRAIPKSIRMGAFALGATRWQTILHHVLPAATPGILTGVILSISRAIGETAPLIMIGALSYVAFVPTGPMDSFTTLPIQIFNWASRPQKEFQLVAASGIIVLVVVLLLMNAIAVILRNYSQKKYKW